MLHLAPALPWLSISLSFRLEKSCGAKLSRWGPSASAELSTDIRSLEHICEQRVATSTRSGSDSSLKPVTSLLRAEDAPVFPELQML